MKVLFTGRTNHAQTQEALDYCLRHFDTTYALGDWGDPIPQCVNDWCGDYIFNYLGRWILPESILVNASEGAINFHPAPPEYPGFGPVNWALYDGADTYGATCHFMDERVDTGDIIAVSRFAIYSEDNVESVTNKTYCYQLRQFYDVIDKIKRGSELRPLWYRWSGVKHTRADLDALSVVNATMPQGEIDRRIRAVIYKRWGIQWL